MATLNQQIWVDQFRKNFYPDTSFIKHTMDLSTLSNYDKITIPSAGIDPEVLINNTTYPISINTH